MTTVFRQSAAPAKAASKTLRVAMVNTDFKLYWPGRIFALRETLRVRGDDLSVVEVSATGTPYDFEASDVPEFPDAWIRLFDKGLRELPPRVQWNSVVAALNRLSPDVVLSGPIAFPSGAAATFWCRKNRRGLVIMDNVRPQDVPRPRSVDFVKRRIYRNVDAVLTSAPSHVEGFVDWGVARENVFTGLDAVDVRRYAAAAKEAANEPSLRGRFRLPDRYFLAMGRQIPVKNWPTLLEAYRTYRRKTQGDSWSLVFVGNGPGRADLEETVRRCRIDGVHFHDFCSQNDTAVYYAFAECLVLASFAETWGQVVAEAMACSRPVLVSDRCGCAKTLVHDGRNGWTFAPDAAAALAAAMVRMSRMDRAGLATMGKASREIVEDFGLDSFACGAMNAVDAVKDFRRGFTSMLDRYLVTAWKGRYRPV